jgi:Zn-dependent protease with chaperone function
VDTLAVARDYLAEIRANFSEEDRAYRSKRTFLAVASPFYGIAMGLLILFTGLAARMRNVATRATRFKYVHVIVFLALYTLLGFVLTFPMEFYSGFLLEHEYGLSNESVAGWFSDQGKSAALTLFFFGVVPLVWLAYKAIKATRRWWLWLATGSIPVVVISILIQPIVIDPMFNEFQPLQDEVLKTRVLALAEKADIPGRNVYQVDKSAQTKALNAYVNGFGASQRIVFWDTILDAMDHDELVFVTGHEMGHYVLGHMWKGIAFFAVMGFALFFLAGKLMEWLVARFGRRWGFTELHDIASMPLFAVALGVVALIAQPLTNGFSRTIEHEADMFALEITHANDAGARAFLKLGSQNKSNPDPSTLETVWLYRHPPVTERVQFMLDYRPWEEGVPNKVWKE